MNRNSYDRNDVENFADCGEGGIRYRLRSVHEIRRSASVQIKLFYIDNEVYFKDNPDPVGTAQEIPESGQKMYASCPRNQRPFSIS